MNKNLNTQLRTLNFKIMELGQKLRSDKLSVAYKADLSPVSTADLKISEFLESELPKILDLPVISEESSLPIYPVRKDWDSFWLIDPIDGTKGYIEGSGEWTVNVALIENSKVKAGLVSCPDLKKSYLGICGKGAWLLTKELSQKLKYQEKPINFLQKWSPQIVGSVHHPEVELNTLKKSLRRPVVRSVGSSLKFCVVADGEADYYPRYTQLMEWDIAAAHGVLKAAGGNVYELGSKKEVSYNSKKLKAPKFEAY